MDTKYSKHVTNIEEFLLDYAEQLTDDKRLVALRNATSELKSISNQVRNYKSNIFQAIKDIDDTLSIHNENN